MLRVSQANDPLEQEADRVADMVMDSFSPDFDVDEYINNTFAASNATRGKTVDDLFPNRVKGLGGGKALPQTERTFFEERFGADFSGVRVYTGPTADEFARAINARAFTYRQDIVFADGEYAPGTREGRRLMAHELTHVLQDKQDVVQRQSNDYYYKHFTQTSEVTRKVVVNKPGIIEAPDGANIREFPDPSLAPFDTLPFNTPVYVFSKDKFDWSYVRTDEGVQGYISTKRINTSMPHSHAMLYTIEPNETATQLGMKLRLTYHAGGIFDPWQEIIAKILHINGGDGNPSKGIYTEKKIFKGKDAMLPYDRKSVDTIKLRAGARIWLPDPEYFKHYMPNSRDGNAFLNELSILCTPYDKAVYIIDQLKKNNLETRSRCITIMATARNTSEYIQIQQHIDEQYGLDSFYSKMNDWDHIMLASFGPLIRNIKGLNEKRAKVIVDYCSKSKLDPIHGLLIAHFMFSTMFDDDIKAVLSILGKDERLKRSILNMPPVLKILEERGIDINNYNKESGSFARGAWEGLFSKDMTYDFFDHLVDLPAPYHNIMIKKVSDDFKKAISNPGNWLDALLFNIPSTAYGMTVGTVQGIIQGVKSIHAGDWEEAGRDLIGPAINIIMIAGMVVGIKAGRGKTIKGPKGKNSFVIKGYTGPVPKEVARLNAILALSSKANATIARIISSIGVKGLKKVAKYARKSNAHALFINKYGAQGAIALYKSGGRVARAQLLMSSVRKALPIPKGTFPESWNKFAPQHHGTFRLEIKKFRGSTKNLDPTESLANGTKLSGGEGKLWLSKRKPTQCLKRWYQSQLTKFPRSVKRLQDTRAVIKANAKLSKDIEVVQVYKVGDDFIIRDFYEKTFTLKYELLKGNKKAILAYERALKALKGTNNFTLQKVLQKLEGKGHLKPSANLHWLKSKNKILIIDMM